MNALHTLERISVGTRRHAPVEIDEARKKYDAVVLLVRRFTATMADMANHVPAKVFCMRHGLHGYPPDMKFRDIAAQVPQVTENIIEPMTQNAWSFLDGQREGRRVPFTEAHLKRALAMIRLVERANRRKADLVPGRDERLLTEADRPEIERLLGE